MKLSNEAKKNLIQKGKRLYYEIARGMRLNYHASDESQDFSTMKKTLELAGVNQSDIDFFVEQSEKQSEEDLQFDIDNGDLYN